MKGFLTSAQIDYVLFHLDHHIFLHEEIQSRFIFQRDKGEQVPKEKICFKLSHAATDQVDRLSINDIPVLFPMTDEKQFFHFDEYGNLIFEHDLLKSAFYLLSGYQEFENKTSRDKLSRFSYFDSLQCRLGIIGIPVVNYYFDIIATAIETFCSKYNIHVKRKRLFANMGFLLSHDVDSIDLYTKNYILYKLKEIAGPTPSRLSRITNARLFVRGLLKYIGINHDNPHWNFTYLRDLEKKHNFKSVFFFLDQGILHSDAYYSFSEPRVIDLFKSLIADQCEIGIHGTVESVTNAEKLQSSIEKLKRFSDADIIGARQHRLLWKHPNTALIQQSAGLKYDSTLGFAAHEGFRNSYCHPFRLFDFEQDKMMDLWELPLNVMDVTLFGYQNYDPTTAMIRCNELTSEIRKFGGVFNFLWHNSFFDETTYPGVTKFYEEMLQKMSDNQVTNVVGKDLIGRMEKHSSFRK
jgi:hypothetical protein